MTRRSETLLWLERGLLVVGAVLAMWAVMVVSEAHFFKRLPVPGAASGLARLPGEGGEASGMVGTTGHSKVSPGEWLGRLEAPSVGLSATVLEGSDDGTLSRGAGHIEATALPGEGGNIGIAAHRDTIFRPVRNLKVGDDLMLTTRDRVFEYQITATTIVNPEDVYVLDPTERPTLTLVTCYPFNFVGHAPKRFIVKAELQSPRPR